MDAVEMRDRLAENLAMSIGQSSGVLSENPRDAEFAQLSADELQRVERIVVDAFDGFSARAEQSGTTLTDGAGRLPEA